MPLAIGLGLSLSLALLALVAGALAWRHHTQKPTRVPSSAPDDEFVPPPVLNFSLSPDDDPDAARLSKEADLASKAAPPAPYKAPLLEDEVAALEAAPTEVNVVPSVTAPRLPPASADLVAEAEVEGRRRWLPSLDGAAPTGSDTHTAQGLKPVVGSATRPVMRPIVSESAGQLDLVDDVPIDDLDDTLPPIRK